MASDEQRQWARWRQHGSYEWTRDSQWEGAQEAREAAAQRRWPDVIHVDGPSQFHLTGPCPNCGEAVAASGVHETPRYDESWDVSAEATCEHCGASVTLKWHHDPV